VDCEISQGQCTVGCTAGSTRKLPFCTCNDGFYENPIDPASLAPCLPCHNSCNSCTGGTEL
jgi:hypothetical protein